MPKDWPDDPRTLTLAFEDRDAFVNVDDPIHKDLSAAARHGKALFLCCDETAGVDRLTPVRNTYGDHRHYDLGDFIDLPAGPDGEMDIEGLDIDGDWLWIVGSHSLTRGKPKAGDTPRKALKRMRKIGRDPNRAFLARVPLAAGEGGPVPVGEDGGRSASHIRLHQSRSALKHWLRGDAHIGAFLDLPSKENGFDIEGLAAKGLRVWLGLRGPVLREHAVILEFQFKITKKRRLKARRLDGGRRYRKHLVCTEGQGIRDLKFDGDDLMILTGPTTAGDGAAQLLRWRAAVATVASGVVPRDRIETAIDLPYRGRHDHPEGIVKWTGPGEWLVVYDAPAPARLSETPARVTADIWTLP